MARFGLGQQSGLSTAVRRLAPGAKFLFTPRFWHDLLAKTGSLNVASGTGIACACGEPMTTRRLVAVMTVAATTSDDMTSDDEGRGIADIR
jgi:hypothetical protein